MGERSGIPALVDELVDPKSEAEQLGAAGEEISRRAAGEQLELAGDEDWPLSKLPRAAGRPKGSRDKTAENWRQFMLTAYGSPLVALFQTIKTPVEELATYLGCTKKEAFEIQMNCAGKAAGFVHPKLQAMAVNVSGQGGSIVLALAGDGSEGLVAPDGMSEEAINRLIPQSDVIDVEPGKSDT